MNTMGGSSSANTLSIIIQLQANQQAAQQATQSLNNVKTAIDNTSKSALSLKQAGRDLREVGSTIAAAGAGMLAPFILAAQQYATQYKGLETTANAYAAAQRSQADATNNLGRVAAQALIPTMNQIADLENKIAAFAQAHPELVQAAVNAGEILAIGGGALAVTGQIAVTLANVQKLLSSGGLVTNLAQAVVGIVAFGVAADATTQVIQQIGKDTGDQFLATFDPLKTFRELMVDTAKDIALFQSSVTIAAAQIDIAIQNLIKGVASFLAKAGIIVPGTQGTTTTSGGFGIGLNIVQGPTPQEAQIAKDQAAIAAASKGYADYLKNNLATTATQNFVNTGTLTGGGGSVGDIVAQVQAKLSGILSGTGTVAAPTPTGTSSNISQSVNDYLKYIQQVKQSDVQYGIDRLKITKDYNNQTLQTERDRAAESQQIARDQAAQETQMVTDQNNAKMKRQQDFNESQKQADEKFAFDRKQRLYQQSLDATNLAAEGDVAGFIAAQQQNIIQNKLADAQFQFDNQQRKEQFDFQEKQQDTADQQARQQQLKQFQVQNTDRQAQYQKEDQDRATAYQNQLTALQTSHQDQLNEMQQAFVQQLAALQDNVDNLNTIQNNYYTNAQASFQAFASQNQTAWQNMLNNMLGSTQGVKPPTASAPPALPSTPPKTGGGMFGFASGTAYVPNDMVAMVHRGEAIIPASQNRGGMGGGISISMPITLNGGSGSGGSITKADLDSFGNEIVQHLDTQLSGLLAATR